MRFCIKILNESLCRAQFKLTGLRLVVTHCLSSLKWSKGCKSLLHLDWRDRPYCFHQQLERNLCTQDPDLGWQPQVEALGGMDVQESAPGPTSQHGHAAAIVAVWWRQVSTTSKKMFLSVFVFLFHGKILFLENILFLVACGSIQGNSYAFNCACGRENCWNAAYRNPMKLLGRGERRENHRHIFSAQKKTSKWVEQTSLLLSLYVQGSRWHANSTHQFSLDFSEVSEVFGAPNTTLKWLTNREQLF